MNVSRLTAIIAMDGRGASAATQDHATIILQLLLLLGTVLLIGALLIIVIRRYLRTRGGKLFSAGQQTQAEFHSDRFFQSSIFQGPNRWVAIKSANPQAVQNALGLHNPTPCSWTEGMAQGSGQKLFISPPVRGWILVVGSLLPEPSEDVVACFRFLQRLSRELGEGQFFSGNRPAGHHA